MIRHVKQISWVTEQMHGPLRVVVHPCDRFPLSLTDQDLGPGRLTAQRFQQ